MCASVQDERMSPLLSIIQLKVEAGYFAPDLKRFAAELARASGQEVPLLHAVPVETAAGVFAYYPGIFLEGGIETFGHEKLHHFAPRTVLLSVPAGKVDRLLEHFAFLAVVEENAMRDWSNGRAGSGTGFIGRGAVLGPDHIAFELPATGYAMATASRDPLPKRLAAYLRKSSEGM